MIKILQSIPYPTYTTAERDLLVDVLKNFKINNSDTGKVEEYDGYIWNSVGGNIVDQTAANTTVDATGFNGNLTPTDDTVQKVAQKFNDYVAGTTTTDYENILFEVAAPDKAYITRGFNFKIASVTEYGGTSTIKTSAGAAYTTGATVTAGDYLTVTNTTINARLVAIIQPA